MVEKRKSSHTAVNDSMSLHRLLTSMSKRSSYNLIVALLTDDNFWIYTLPRFHPSLRRNLTDVVTRSVFLLKDQPERLKEEPQLKKKLNQWLEIIIASVHLLANDNPVNIRDLVPPSLLAIDTDPTNKIMLAPDIARILQAGLVNCILNGNDASARTLICISKPTNGSRLTSIIVANDGPAISDDIFKNLGKKTVTSNTPLDYRDNGTLQMVKAANSMFGITMIQRVGKDKLQTNTLAQLNHNADFTPRFQNDYAQRVYQDFYQRVTGHNFNTTVATIFFTIPSL